MIKCDNCGRKISLETSRCPECNAVNEIAMEHFRELAIYDKKYKRAEELVERQAEDNKGFALRIAIIGVLALVSVCLLIFAINPVDVYNDIFVFNAKYEKQIEAQKAQYLSDQEYERFAALHKQTDKYVDSTTYWNISRIVEDYDQVIDYSRKYKALMDNKEENIKLGRMENNLTSYCQYTASSIVNFVKIEAKLETDADNDLDISAATSDMRTRMKLALVYYWGMSEEESEAVWTMDQPHIQFLLEQLSKEALGEDPKNLDGASSDIIIGGNES